MPPSSKNMSVQSTRGLLCPFLFQTRTILRQHPEYSSIRLLSTTVPCWGKNQSSNPLSDDSDQNASTNPSSFLKQKAAKVVSSKPRVKSSITPAEQAAFDDIWAMFKKPSPSTPKSLATSTNHADTDYKNILDLFSTPATQPQDIGSTPIDNYINQDEQTHSSAASTSRSHDVTSNLFKPKHPATRRADFNRKSTMAEISDFLKDSNPSLPVDNASPSAESKSQPSIYSTAQTIVEDAAESFTQALSSHNPRPDIAMWRVAESKVFPLIRLLRPSPSSLSSLAPDTPPASTPNDTTTPHHQHPLIPPSLPLIPLLSLTYPSLTLLTLRLYANHHPTSPYALALLPTLRSLGPTSYVLGAHTHFYNALLSIYWRIYSDLKGMNGLLAEMEANGVDFDLGTWKVLHEIGLDRERDLSGGKRTALGEGRGKTWWRRPEQVIWWRRLGEEWKDTVKRTLEEKGVRTGEVMREEAGAFVDGEKPDYVVTL